MSPPRVRPLLLAALTAAMIVVSGCGGEEVVAPPPVVLPNAISLTAHERARWAPLPETRKGIPVLLYHGIGEIEDFENAADASYGVTQRDFAKQMALLKVAGYEPITLAQLRAFLAGEDVELPPRPVLLTFDDALQSSFDGADAVLRQLGWRAVMYVDAGAVDEGSKGYASWQRVAEAQRSGRWQVQLHAGRGHHNIVYDDEGSTGPFYAYRDLRSESFAAWQRRVIEDLEWGEGQLREHVPGYEPLSFAPPYGNFGQVSTDDPRIPRTLDAWLRERYGYVFVQEPARYATPGATVVARLQITRRMSGGDLRAWLAEQLPARR